ncbi:cytochrome c(L), periplasmic [Aureimonas sp. OT7]|uniref:cytochrome c(L), periplasmic n=1 Tax=Aureimonas TaxID=414371 RepID=UPI000690C826|nr:MULTISPECIES: cytochrome c(L), periplasmic [Aureimonas]QOG06259.1 cytochrome c(L), periplasmic [Aureimonas sp. OT7]
MTLKTIFLAGGAALAFTFAAAAQMQFSHTVEGTPLDLSFAPEDGRDTEAVKAFLQTGVNQYNEQPEALKEGEELYLTACSGCHGHVGEGKLGPGLNDSYWTYPKNETDKGLFETIYGGAQGMMGPQYGHLNLDEMLKVMAWTRHLFTGDPSEAVWLTREQRQSFKPYGSEGG